MKKLSLYVLSCLAAVVYLFVVIILGTLIILVSFVSSSKFIFDKIIYAWTTLSLWLFRVQIKNVKGLENIPKGSCLFMFNHSSHFDILVLQNTVPRVRFGAKIELFSIPFFGPAMRRVGALPIARNRIEEVKKVYLEAEKRTVLGECFALAPEGTRQLNGRHLGLFKSGPFVFAINAGIPIVPVIVKGCYEVLPKNKFVPSVNNWIEHTSISFGPPIKVEKGNLELKSQLQQKTRHWMEQEMHKKDFHVE